MRHLMELYTAQTRGERLGLVVCGFIVLISILVLTVGLSQKPFWDYDEAIYANVIHHTAISANPLTLWNSSGPFFEKPPLYFWLAIGCDAVLNHPELAYRIPGIVSGVLIIIFGMLILYELTRSYRYAALAGLVLLTSPAFMEASRQVRLDGLATLSTVAGLYFFIRAQQNSKFYYLFGAVLALGVLSKLVIGLFAVPIILLWALVFRNFTWLTSSRFYQSVGVFFLVVLPWHLYQFYLYGTDFVQVYIVENLFSRVGADLITLSYTNLQYVQFILIYGAPWTPLLVPALGVSLYLSRRSVYAQWALVFLVGALVLFGIFLITSTKILYYLVPIYPIVGLGIASAGAALYEVWGARARVLLVAIASLLFIGAAYFSYTVIFHRFGQLAINDAITADEYQAAQILKAQPQRLPVKAFVYNYFDTIQYYSEKGSIEMMNPQTAFTMPMYLIVRTGYVDANPIPPQMAAHFTLLYRGFFVSLYQFAP